MSFYNKGEQYKGGTPMSTIFIGIAGGTGSGKTTLTEHLAQRFGSDISVVHHDNYYKRRTAPSRSGAARITTTRTPLTPI